MTEKTAERRLSDFVGVWLFDRRIQHADAPDALAHGSAEWSPVEAGLLYHETAELHIQGHRAMKTERRYIWRAPLDVHFDDGRFFHSVPAEGGETLHHCAPDTYRCVYRFAGWPRFETVWRVTGPRKDYRMITQYRPT